MVGMREEAPDNAEPATLRAVRRWLLAILVVACIGTLIELLLLDHDEDVWQLVPLVLLSAGIVCAAWATIRPSAAAVRSLQALMCLFVASGGAGLYFHYSANVEFQRDLDPSLASMALFWKVMAAKAPPALAPAVMAQLGLIGLVFSYRHPALGRKQA